VTYNTVILWSYIYFGIYHPTQTGSAVVVVFFECGVELLSVFFMFLKNEILIFVLLTKYNNGPFNEHCSPSISDFKSSP